MICAPSSPRRQRCYGNPPSNGDKDGECPTTSLLALAKPQAVLVISNHESVVFVDLVKNHNWISTTKSCGKTIKSTPCACFWRPQRGIGSQTYKQTHSLYSHIENTNETKKHGPKHIINDAGSSISIGYSAINITKNCFLAGII